MPLGEVESLETGMAETSSPENLLQIFLFVFYENGFAIGRHVGLVAAEEAFGEGAHFGFGEGGAGFYGLLPGEGADHFFAEGEYFFAAGMLAVFEHFFNELFFVAGFQSGGSALDDKSIFSEGLDGIAERAQVRKKFEQQYRVGRGKRNGGRK